MTRAECVRGLLTFVTCLLVLSGSPATLAALVRSADPAPAWRDFMTMRSGASPAIDYPYRACFVGAAAEHDLPVSLLVAVARGESNFDPDAVSSANARGLMQILWPGTGRELGFRSAAELHEPCPNIEAGARYLSGLLERYNGDLHLALAAYNYGPGRIPADGRFVPDGARWSSSSILRHLEYVLGEVRPGPAERDWEGDRQLAFAFFRAPYRADAFVSAMQASEPTVRLDWFREDVARFSVVLLYASTAEREAGLARLRRAGMAVDGG
jgi:hypothetical protein